MRNRYILTILLILFSIQFANAQQTEIKTSLDVVRLVTEANLKLNTIYRNRVSGHEQEKASLRKAVYAANGELIEIRGMLTGGDVICTDKMAFIQKQITSLQESITVVDETLTDVDLLKVIYNVQSNAVSLKKSIKKIKR